MAAKAATTAAATTHHHVLCTAVLSRRPRSGQPDRHNLRTTDRTLLTASSSGCSQKHIGIHAVDQAFSKKLINLEAAVAIFMAFYNFCRVH